MAQIKIMERPLIVAVAYVSGVILAAVLIGLWRFGIDLGSVFFGTHPATEPSRGIMAIEGGLVFITLIFGGLFIFSVTTLITDRRPPAPPARTE